LTGWFGPEPDRQGQVLALKHAEFVTAARGAGRDVAGFWRGTCFRIWSRPFAVAATLGVAHVIVLEAGLS
jgi:ABC-type dipeptide/oligopeptide/nickel transport system permease subunit